MEIGDRVILTKKGELQVLPQRGQGQADDEGEGEWIGTVADVRESPDESIVALRTSEPNVAPPLATLADVRSQYQYGKGQGEA